MRNRTILAALSVFLASVTTVHGNDSLQVLAMWPRGQLDAASQALTIVASFNKPMLPMQQLPEGEGSGPLTIAPPVAGKYRWLGTSTLSFTPAKPFDLATEYTVTIKAGTRALDGSTLAADVVWTFTTQRPVLLGTRPGHNSKGIDVRTSLLLHFNQTMVAEKALPFIKLFEGKRNGPELRFTLSHPTHEEMEKQYLYVSDSSVVLKLTPLQPLKKQTRYVVLLNAGLPGASGKLGMAKEASFAFETYANLAFLGIADSINTNPKAGVRFRFTTPVAIAELVKNISFVPPVEVPDYYKEWTWSSSDIFLTLPLAPHTQYRCTINKDLIDVFGQRLGKDAAARWTTAGFEPMLAMTGGHGVLEAYGVRKYPVRVVNINAFRVQMRKLSASNLVPTLTALETAYEGLPFTFDVDRVQSTNAPPDVETTVGVSFDDVFGGQGYGAALLQVSRLEPVENRVNVFRADVQITAMGITAKFSPENVLIWLTTLKEARPISDAVVQLRDDANRLLWEGRTNAEGFAEAPGWGKFEGIAKPAWSQPRLWVIALHDEDMAYTASNWNRGIEPYRFNIATDWNPQVEPLQGVLFTDRGIYRQGEDVEIKGIFRARRLADWAVAKGMMLLRLRDPQGEQVFLDSMMLNEFGSLAVRFPIPPEARLGYYSIEASVRTKGEAEPYRIVGAASFRVEAYRVSEFEVTARVADKEYIVGDPVRCLFTARYLFGGEMKGEKIRWRARYEPAMFTPEGWESYQFGRYWYGDAAGPRPKLLISKDTVLDKQGTLHVEVKTQVGDIRTSGNLLLEADVTSPSRQTVSGRTRVVLHAGEWYIGIGLKSTFVMRESTLSYTVVAVRPNGEVVPGVALRARIIKREWHSVRKASARGGFEWFSEAVDSTIHTFQFSSDTQPVVQTFTPHQSGLYVIEISGADKRGNEIGTEAYFYASGSDYVAWERTDDDRIELIADAKRYKPGQTARIIVKNPYEQAVALVSVEREGVLRYWRTTLKGSAPEIAVPLDNQSLPNVFVSVMLLQGRVTRTLELDQEKDVGKPSFKIGYIELPVDPGTRHLAVAAEPDRKEYRPGDSVRVTLRVKDAAGNPARSEVTVSVADKGVLNLIGYRLPDPFDPFYGSRPLAVITTEARSQIVQARSFGEKGEDEGGGGGVDFGAVEARGNFKSTAFWNAHLVTDSAGLVAFAFKLPDNLTTFTIMCVAQTKQSAFGYGEASIVVNKPLLLQASLPRFARMGDRFEAGVVVHNFTNAEGRVTLQFTAEGIEWKGKKVVELSLGAGESKEVRQPVHAIRAGSATFTCKALMGAETDGLTVSIPVRIAPRKETVADVHAVQASTELQLVVPRNSLAGLGTVEFTAASSALAGLENSVEYLFTYPYGCIEQKCSAILPIIFGKDMVEAFGLRVLKNTDARAVVQATLNEVRRFQIWNGGFSYWAGTPYDVPYASAYVMYVLAAARQRGYTVHDEMLRRGTEYIKGVLRWQTRVPQYPYDEQAWVLTKTFILYTLALLGSPEPAYYESYFKMHDRIPLEARAYLLKAIALSTKNKKMMDALSTNLLNNIKINPTSAHFEEPNIRGLEWCWVSPVRTTALLLQTLMEARAFTGGRADLPSKILRWLMDQQRAGRWSSTQENVYVVHALATYFSAVEQEEPKFRAEIRVATERVLSHLFEGRSLKIQRSEKKLDSFEKGKELPLHIVKEGAGVLYAGIRMTYYPATPILPADEGIVVTKTLEVLSSAQRTPGTFPAGALVKTTLRVITPQQRSFVVVDDPVPAGFQIVNTSLQTESTELGEMLQESREQEQQRWWGSFNYQQLHDDRVLLFADQLNAGVHTFTYLARAITPGTFSMPATHAEMMYEPEVFGRTGSTTIEVQSTKRR